MGDWPACVRAPVTASVARLDAVSVNGATRVARAFAASPQRWTVSSPSIDGWTTATHQLLGDGSFGGDTSRTIVSVRPGAKLLVQGVTATALRGCGASMAATHLRVARGGAVLHIPGPVVPHRGSTHDASLHIDADDGAFVLAASTLVAGRMGLGERGAYERLRLHTKVTVGGSLAFREELEVDPDEWASSPLVSHTEALVTVIFVGAQTEFELAEWQALAGPNAFLGASPLRVGGHIVRGVFADLGAAQKFLGVLETNTRRLMKRCDSLSDFA